MAGAVAVKLFGGLGDLGQGFDEFLAFRLGQGAEPGPVRTLEKSLQQ